MNIEMDETKGEVFMDESDIIAMQYSEAKRNSESLDDHLLVCSENVSNTDTHGRKKYKVESYNDPSIEMLESIGKLKVKAILEPESKEISRTPYICNLCRKEFGPEKFLYYKSSF